MAYPTSFHRIVIGGTHYAETWNTSLNYAPGFANQPVDTALLTAIAGHVQTWFAGTPSSGVGFPSPVKLTYCKVNRINSAGHYQDPESHTHTYPSPVAGGGTLVYAPPQNAMVVTLRTAFERGLASKGRMYLPLPQNYAALASDGRATAAQAITIANSVTSLINNVNAAFSSWAGGGDAGHVAIMSNVREGAFHFVTQVEAGRVVDTMRSRRTSMPEDYQPAAAAIP
jgi:hypothetical protein